MSKRESRDPSFVGMEAYCLCIIATFLKTSTNEIGCVIKLYQWNPTYERGSGGDAFVSCQNELPFQVYLFRTFCSELSSWQ